MVLAPVCEFAHTHSKSHSHTTHKPTRGDEFADDDGRCFLDDGHAVPPENEVLKIDSASTVARNLAAQIRPIEPRRYT